MPFVLGHALSRRASHGGQAKHDRSDSHTIAALRRGGLRPHADVSPRRLRATRDLLRRRHPRMHQRAERYAHLQQTASRSHLSAPWGRLAKPQNRRGLSERVAHRCVQKNMAVDVALVDGSDPLLAALERDLEKTAQGHAPVSLARLRTIPGVGNSLALVMRSEIEQSARFPGSRRSSPTAAWSSVRRHRMANGTAPAARRSATPISSGRSRQRRCSVASTTSPPKHPWRSSLPAMGRARRCRASPTNWDGRSSACARIKSRSTRRSSWPPQAGGSGPAWRLTGAIGAAAHRRRIAPSDQARGT
jgi:hypothetical protein